MVMDENGRNGGNWYLAQQLAQHVIRCILSQVVTNHTPCNQTTYHAIINNNIPHNKPHSLIHNNNYHTDIGGIFISLISIKNSPHTL